MQQTPEQITFCDEMSFGTESILLNAVAGSGKTTTILMGLKESPIPPSQTLLLAFNKKIADDLVKRAPSGTNVLTLNSLGHRAWAAHTGKRLFLDTKKVGTIVSDLCKSPDRETQAYLQSLWAPAKDLVGKAKSIGILPAKYNTGKTLTPDTQEEWEYLASLHGIDFNESIYKISHAALCRSIDLALAGTIDFDDQLYMTACFRASLQKYRLVLIDEAQDLSELQHFLIGRTVSPDGKLVIVGDPNQAIYGFRGAHSDSMSVLGSKFNAKPLTLSYTFRCSKEATALAQKIVPEIKPAQGNLQGEVTQLGLQWELDDIRDGAAVLCRNIAPIVKLGLKLIGAGRSAYIAGRDIGAPLIKAAKTLGEADLQQSIIRWEADETAKAGKNLALLERVKDISEALLGVVQFAEIKDKNTLVLTLQSLFAKTDGSIVLSTIHRAKGLEWDDVYILDYWRMPQKWILYLIRKQEEEKALAAERGQDFDQPSLTWMLRQESNLKYIALTRTKSLLTFINFPEK